MTFTCLELAFKRIWAITFPGNEAKQPTVFWIFFLLFWKMGMMFAFLQLS